MGKQIQGKSRNVLAAVAVVLIIAAILFVSAQFISNSDFAGNFGTGLFSLSESSNTSSGEQTSSVSVFYDSNNIPSSGKSTPNSVVEDKINSLVNESNSVSDENGLNVVTRSSGEGGRGTGSSSSGSSNNSSALNSNSGAGVINNTSTPLASEALKLSASIGIESFKVVKLSKGSAVALSNSFIDGNSVLRKGASFDSNPADVNIGLVSYGIINRSYRDANGVVWYELSFFNSQNPQSSLGMAWVTQDEIVELVAVVKAKNGKVSVSNGRLLTQFLASPFANYTIQSRDSLSASYPWVDRNIMMSDENGIFVFSDAMNSPTGMRFYQAIITPNPIPADTFENHFSLISSGSGYSVGDTFEVGQGGPLLENVLMYVMSVDDNGGITAFVIYANENTVLSKNTRADKSAALSLTPAKLVSKKSKLSFDGTGGSGWGSDCADENGVNVCWPTAEEYLEENYHGCWAQISNVTHPIVPADGSLYSISVAADFFGPDCSNGSVSYKDIARANNVHYFNDNPCHGQLFDIDTSALEFPLDVSEQSATVVITNFLQSNLSMAPVPPQSTVIQGEISIGAASQNGNYSGGDTWSLLIGLPLDTKADACISQAVADANTQDRLTTIRLLAGEKAMYLGCLDSIGSTDGLSGVVVVPTVLPQVFAKSNGLVPSSAAHFSGYPECENLVFQDYCGYYGEGACEQPAIDLMQNYVSCNQYTGDLGSYSDIVSGIDQGIGEALIDSAYADLNFWDSELLPLDVNLSSYKSNVNISQKRTSLSFGVVNNFSAKPTVHIRLDGGSGGGTGNPGLDSEIEKLNNTAKDISQKAEIAAAAQKASLLAPEIKKLNDAMQLHMKNGVAFMEIANNNTSLINTLIKQGVHPTDPQILELMAKREEAIRIVAQEHGIAAKYWERISRMRSTQASLVSSLKVKQIAAAEAAANAAKKIGAVEKTVKIAEEKPWKKRLCQVGRGVAKWLGRIAGFLIAVEVIDNAKAGDFVGAADTVANVAIQSNPYGFMLQNFGGCIESSIGPEPVPIITYTPDPMAATNFANMYELSKFAANAKLTARYGYLTNDVNTIQEKFDRELQLMNMLVDGYSNTNTESINELGGAVNFGNMMDTAPYCDELPNNTPQ